MKYSSMDLVYPLKPEVMDSNGLGRGKQSISMERKSVPQLLGG